jgi:uncharacterized OB-fold protein
MTERIRPVDFDRDTGPFFAAAREGRLVYRHCTDCDRGVHVPTVTCKHCGSTRTEWREASGTASLYSWTRIAATVHPAYPAPYAIVLVALDDAPDVRLVGRIDGTPELTPGQPMEVWFEDIGEGQMLPQWRPALNSN